MLLVTCRLLTAKLPKPLLIFAFVMLALIGATPRHARAAEISEAEIQNRRCLGACHGDSKIADLGPKERLQMIDPSAVNPAVAANAAAKRPGLLVVGEPLSISVHKDLACVACHKDAVVLPHSPMRTQSYP